MSRIQMSRPVRRRPSRRVRIRRLVVASIFGFLVLGTGIAAAYMTFIADSSSNGATALADALPTGATPAGTAAGTNTASVSWAQAKVVNGSAVVGEYRVKRYDTASASTPVATFDCTATITGTTASCPDDPGTGTWYYTETPKISNWLGTESPKSAGVAVDKTAPGAPTIGFPASSGAYNAATWAAVSGSASDTGGSGVQKTQVQLQGAAGYWNGTNFTGTSSTWLDASGTSSWSLTIPRPADGSYTVNARTVDGSTNVGSTSSATFVIDTAAPALTLTAPADGSTVTTSAPTFSGAAGTVAASATTSADLPAVTVKVYSGTSAIGTPVTTLNATASNGAWSATPGSALTPGTYTAQASQSDGAGNTTARTSTFTINAAPTVTLATPADGGATNNRMPTLSGTAGTASGDSTTITVKVYSGAATTGTLVNTLTPTRTGSSWSIPYPSPGGGLPANAQYTAQASQTNSTTGLTGLSSANTFVVDTTAPAVAFSAPASGGTATSSVVSFSGTAGNASASTTSSADSSTVTVNVYSGTTATGTPVQQLTATRTGTSWQVASAALVSGIYTVSAIQTDGAGNSGSVTETFNVSLPPAVTITTPADGAYVNDTTPTLGGAAGTASGDATSVTVTIVGTAVVNSPATVTSGQWSLTVPSSKALSPATRYTAQVTQSNATGAGNSATATSAFVVDTQSPSVAVTSPAASTYTNTTPAISGTAGTTPAGTTASADASTVTVNIYSGATVGGTLLQSLSANVSAGSWSVNPAALAGNAQYTVQAVQSDAAGNTGTSAAVSFTVDIAAPAVTVTSPGSAATVTTATPTLSGGAGNQGATSTASADSPTVTVRVYAGADSSGTAVQTIAVTRSTTTWTTTASALTSGQYTVTATQADGAGNSTTATRTFFVSVAPSPTVASPAAGSYTNNAAPTISGTAGQASGDATTVTVEVLSGASVIRTMSNVAVSSGSWTTTVSPALSGNAQYSARVTQSNSTGSGTSGTSASVSFTVDTSAPSVVFAQVGSAGFTKSTAPAFSGTVGGQAATSTASADIASVVVKVYAGTNTGVSPLQTSPTVAASAGNWTWTPAALGANAQYTAVVSQLDNAGNTGTASRTFVVDTAAPGPTVNAIGNSFGFVTTGAPTITGTAGVQAQTASASADAATVTVNIYSGTATSGTAVRTSSTVSVGANGAWSWTPTALTTNGQYTVVATQTDGASNTGSSTGTTFTFDNLPPTITSIAMGNGGTSGRVDVGDTLTMTFSVQMDATSFCSTWSNTGVQTVSNAQVVITSPSGNNSTDTLGITSPACVNFGSVSLSANWYDSTGTATFAASSLTWDPSTDVLKITLGGTPTLSGVTQKTGVSPATNDKTTYTLPTSTHYDLAGNGMTGTPAYSSSPSGTF